jgi:PRTRC genetic system protein A
MKHSDTKLLTPVHLKLSDKTPWPEEESTFYLVASNGTFICRNHPLFQSCVRTDQGPGELASQRSFLKMKYPKISRRLMEQVIGFFHIIAKRHNSEAGVLLLWNSVEDSLEVLVPKQTGIVGQGYLGGTYPLELEYEIPPLPQERLLIGDIHSHVNYAAYSSSTDKADERHRPGLHLVVGRIDEEPPEFHCEVIADGMRFRVSNLDLIMEGYHERRPAEVPEAWLEQVTIETQRSYSLTGDSTYSYRSSSDAVLEAEQIHAAPSPSGSADNGALCSTDSGIEDHESTPGTLRVNR